MHLEELCTDTAEDMGLLSKMVVTPPVYEPGACEPSGGEPIGSLELKKPSTFCCQ